MANGPAFCEATEIAKQSITEQNAKLPIKHPPFDMITTRMGLGIVDRASV
jgi:hypothetical protein